jgi:hypothetical protein
LRARPMFKGNRICMARCRWRRVVAQGVLGPKGKEFIQWYRMGQRTRGGTG